MYSPDFKQYLLDMTKYMTWKTMFHISADINSLENLYATSKSSKNS